MQDAENAQLSKVEKVAKRAGDFGGYLVKITAAWGIIWSAICAVVWSLAKDEILAYVNAPWVLIELSREFDRFRDETGRNIAKLGEQIDDQKISPKIAEYDLLRSGVNGGACHIGGRCTVEFRVRRTIRGAECGRPQADRRLRNHYGRTYPIPSNPRDAVRADGDWITIPSTFRIPVTVEPGRGEYFIRLSYPGCPWMEPGLDAKESTPTIEFEILPEQKTGQGNSKQE